MLLREFYSTQRAVVLRSGKKVIVRMEIFTRATQDSRSCPPPPVQERARAARAPDVRGWTVVSRRSSELVPQFEGEGHGNQLSVAVPHQLCAGRVALASEPTAEAPDQTDGVAEARRRRQLA